jgi:hypothetical protein
MILIQGASEPMPRCPLSPRAKGALPTPATLSSASDDPIEMVRKRNTRLPQRAARSLSINPPFVKNYLSEIDATSFKRFTDEAQYRVKSSKY